MGISVENAPVEGLTRASARAPELGRGAAATGAAIRARPRKSTKRHMNEKAARVVEGGIGDAFLSHQPNGLAVSQSERILAAHVARARVVESAYECYPCRQNAYSRGVYNALYDRATTMRAIIQRLRPFVT